jgi:hypothetical protein
MKIQRKHHMTLLEVLVSMSLLVVLLGLVFGFFLELNKINNVMEKEQAHSFRQRYVEMRLAHLFSNVISHTDNTDKKYSYFFTNPPKGEASKSNSLVLSYWNGVRLDPSFSGNVIGRLYIDSKNQLCLAVWPLYSKDPVSEMHKEVLMENVEGMRFQFFAYPPINNQTLDSENKPQRGWQEEWQLAYKQPPVIVRIYLKLKEEGKEEKEEFLYAFPIVVTDSPILYPAA